MKLLLLPYLCLLSLFHVAVSQTTFVLVRGRNKKTNHSVEVCGNVQYGSTIDQRARYPLAFWPGNDDRWCNMPQERVSLAAKVTYGKYSPFNGSDCNKTEPFYVNDRLDYLRALDGGVALFLKENLSFSFSSPYVNLTRFNGSVFYIDSSNFESIQKLYDYDRSKAGNLHIQFYKPTETPITPIVAIFMLIPTLCVILGGWWSGKTHFELSPTAAQKKENETVSIIDSSKQRSERQRSEAAAVPFNCLAVVVFLTVSVTIMVILFYFYDYAVYAILFFYLVGVVNVIYTCLCTFLPIQEWLDYKVALPMFFNRLLYCCCKRQWYKQRLIYPFQISMVLLSSVAPLIWFFYRKQWFAFIIQDLLGVVLSIGLIRALRMPSLKWLTILLLCFLLYDVFMIFISPLITKGCSIMLYVALGGSCEKSGNAYEMSEPRERLPLCLLIPRLSSIVLKCVQPAGQDSYPLMILGLGDIIIPGTVVGYNFAIDFHWKKTGFVYSALSIIGYTLGTYLSLMMVFWTGEAQPALIYLVPAVLVPTHLVGLCRREWKHLWNGQFVKVVEKKPADMEEVTENQ